MAIHRRNIALTRGVAIFADGTLAGRQSHLVFHRMKPAGAERHRREAQRVSLLARTNQTPYTLHMPELKPLVAVIMGSKSDWETMRHAVETLDELGVPNEAHVLS